MVLKLLTPLVCFAWSFYNQTVFQKIKIGEMQILDTSWIDKNTEQNVKVVCFWASCISGIIKENPG